jgi:hypothetical protein
VSAANDISTDLKVGCLHPVVCTRSGSGFPCNATLFWTFYLVTATCFGRMTIFRPYATCPAHLILPNLIILITLGEGHKLWSSWLCSPLHPSLHLSSVQMFSNTLSLYSSFNVIDKIFAPIQNHRPSTWRWSYDRNM